MRNFDWMYVHRRNVYRYFRMFGVPVHTKNFYCTVRRAAAPSACPCTMVFDMKNTKNEIENVHWMRTNQRQHVRRDAICRYSSFPHTFRIYTIAQNALIASKFRTSVVWVDVVPSARHIDADDIVTVAGGWYFEWTLDLIQTHKNRIFSMRIDTHCCVLIFSNKMNANFPGIKNNIIRRISNPSPSPTTYTFCGHSIFRISVFVLRSFGALRVFFLFILIHLTFL